jgi:hypothetical protein
LFSRIVSKMPRLTAHKRAGHKDTDSRNAFGVHLSGTRKANIGLQILATRKLGQLLLAVTSWSPKTRGTPGSPHFSKEL